MATGQALHMNHGEGEGSYAYNSTIQSAEQNRMKPLIEEAVTCLVESTKPRSRVAIADLGCSSGPNALALVSGAVEAIFQHYARHEQLVPQELCVLLNDLPGNDFNSVAKRLAEFQDSANDDQRTGGRITVGIVPGSFYTTLFTSSSLHLVLSSSSVHWLSRAPEDLRTNGIPMCDDEDELRKARRPLVLEAYARQFKKDFNLFLNLRAQELAPGGQMVISMKGRCAGEDKCHSNLGRDAVAFVLNDMAKRGVIDRGQLDTFYIPMHLPSEEEVREIIEEEGSFKINRMLVHDFMSGMDKSSVTPKSMALWMRAAFEPMIAQHFGKSDQMVDDFLRTTERYLSMGTPPRVPTASLVFTCVSLTKIV